MRAAYGKYGQTIAVKRGASKNQVWLEALRRSAENSFATKEE